MVGRRAADDRSAHRARRLARLRRNTGHVGIFVRFIRSPVAEQGLAGLGDNRVPVPLRGAVIALSVSLVAMEAPHQRAPQRTGSHHRERETEEHNHHDEKAKIRRGPRTRGGTHREIHNFSFARRTNNSLVTQRGRLRRRRPRARLAPPGSSPGSPSRALACASCMAAEGARIACCCGVTRIRGTHQDRRS
jgi:hypothetical protein